MIHILPRQINNTRYFLGELHRTRDQYKSGYHSWPKCKFVFIVVDVHVSLFSANDSVKYTLWYISCPDKLLTQVFFLGELHRTRDQYKSGHHSWSKCKFFLTVADVHVSLFSSNDCVKYTLFLPRQIINTRYFLGELHRTRDQYKSGHHFWSKCKFFLTVADVHVSLFSSNDCVKYTLFLPR